MSGNKNDLGNSTNRLTPITQRLKNQLLINITPPINLPNTTINIPNKNRLYRQVVN